MLIVLHDKELSNLEDLATSIRADTCFRADGPNSMAAIEEEIADVINEGRTALLLVPTFAIGVTYALIEECAKMVPVWQLKAQQRVPVITTKGGK